MVYAETILDQHYDSIDQLIKTAPIDVITADDCLNLPDQTFPQ